MSTRRFFDRWTVHKKNQRKSPKNHKNQLPFEFYSMNGACVRALYELLLLLLLLSWLSAGKFCLHKLLAVFCRRPIHTRTKLMWLFWLLFVVSICVRFYNYGKNRWVEYFVPTFSLFIHSSSNFSSNFGRIFPWRSTLRAFTCRSLAERSTELSFACWICCWVFCRCQMYGDVAEEKWGFESVCMCVGCALVGFTNFTPRPIHN